jgi:hypothetical protein
MSFAGTWPFKVVFKMTRFGHVWTAHVCSFVRDSQIQIGRGNQFVEEKFLKGISCCHGPSMSEQVIKSP